MKETRPAPPAVEWKEIVWQQTPYEGVFISKIVEKQDPSNPNTPLLTIMALKMEPRAIIPLHRHNREAGWTEKITLPNGGWIEIKSDQEPKQIKTESLLTIVIRAGEIFGLKNMDSRQSLYFLSTMRPGFTGYGEIEEIERKKRSKR